MSLGFALSGFYNCEFLLCNLNEAKVWLGLNLVPFVLSFPNLDHELNTISATYCAH